MKRLLTILLGLFWTAYIYADCSGEGLHIFPIGQTISQNSIFVLDGYALSQQVILELNRKYPIYLKSGNKKVKLIVKEICIGQFELTQAILYPEAQLETEFEYELFIDNLPERESLKRYNEKTNEYEQIKYTVVNVIDTDKPVLTSRPKEIDKSFEVYGCGPAMSVNFDFPVKDNSEIIVKTTVKNIKSRIETTYYIVPHNSQITVGHGMCSGAFTYDDSNDYEAEFSFMDASGNLTGWTGERIKFTKPTNERWDDWKKKK
jgi:hypothetical protein